MGDSNDPIEDKEFCMTIEDINKALGKGLSANKTLCSNSQADESIDPSTTAIEYTEMYHTKSENCLERIYTNAKKCQSISVAGYDNDIQPTRQWCDAFFFSDTMKTYLKTLYNDIDEAKAFGWPFIMRNGSLIYVGKRSNSEALCLPVVSARLSVSSFFS